MAYCTKCGHKVDGAFCSNCGNPISSAKENPRPGAGNPENAAQPGVYNGGGAEEKPKRGLLIGIIAAAAAAAVLLIFLFAGGTPVAGVWYDGTNRAVLEFAGGGNVYSYTAGDMQGGKYEYDKFKGEGMLALDGQIYDFLVAGDKLNLQNAGIYLRADKNFDIDQFLTETSASAQIPEETAYPTEEPSFEPPPAEETEVVENLPLTLSFTFGDNEGIYSGEMKGGLPNGQGAFTSASPDGFAWTYEGMWADGHFSGEGVISWEDGYARGGEYANDEVNGTGWQSWDGALEYEGGYANSEFQGDGTLYNYYGTVIYSGPFNHGRMQESAQERDARVGAFKGRCTPYTYEEMEAACDGGIELFAVITGTVYEVDDEDYENESNPAWVYIELPPGEGGQMEYVTVRYWMSEGETLPEVGQAVTAWGTTRKNYQYNDENGNEWSEPSIEAWSIEAVAE